MNEFIFLSNEDIKRLREKEEQEKRKNERFYFIAIHILLIGFIYKTIVFYKHLIMYGNINIIYLAQINLCAALIYYLYKKYSYVI